MSSTRKIILKSSDAETFEVEETVAVESLTLKNMIDDGCTDGVIPLPNVTGRIVAKAMEYCRKHAESRAGLEDEDRAKKVEEDLKEWDDEFVKVDQGTLFDLILAANYLNIQGLMDRMCTEVADMMRGKKPEEIRKIFHIKNDYTPEEEAEIQRENQWSFE